MVEGLLDEAEGAGAGDGFGAAVDAELAEDASVMAFHRIHSHEKLLADLSIGVTRSNQIQYLKLSYG